MKNYYDELEISKTASKEVIEKVYKFLAKKYHPDTTQEADKQAAEERFKIISEAYEILSDDEKRKKYDLDLESSNPTISYEEYVNVVNERDSLNYSLNNLKNEFNQFRNSSNNTYQNYNNNNHQYYNANQVNPNFNGNNVYNNINTYHNSEQNYNNKTSERNSKKKTYYYTNTGKPASAFAYYKYKIKQFFSNIGFFLLLILVIILIINAYTGLDLFSLL